MYKDQWTHNSKYTFNSNYGDVASHMKPLYPFETSNAQSEIDGAGLGNVLIC